MWWNLRNCKHLQVTAICLHCSDPNGGDLPYWPVYALGDPAYLELGDGTSFRAHKMALPQTEYCKMWADENTKYFMTLNWRQFMDIYDKYQKRNITAWICGLVDRLWVKPILVQRYQRAEGQLRSLHWDQPRKITYQNWIKLCRFPDIVHTTSYIGISYFIGFRLHNIPRVSSCILQI